MANETSDSPSFDKGLVQSAIGKNSEIHLVKSIKLELKGGDRIESRILVVTGFRVFILTPNTKGPYKVDLSIHILDIHAIESKKPEQVVIHYGEKQTRKFCLTKSGSANSVIGQIIANTRINFPGGNLDESLRKVIEPSDKLDAIDEIINKLTSSETLAEAGPCGGFSRSYACICDHYGVPFLEEVAWDIDTIYLSNDTKEFNIQDFDHLEPRELVPIIATLEYNGWFTKLACESYKLSAEILDVIARVIKRSTTIEELVLDGVTMGREFCQKLATALTSNPKSSLERIDLSNNPSAEDRGITHLMGGFSKLAHGLNSLSLQDTSITSKGASTIGQMLKNSKYMSTSLTRLNLSNNPLKVDGVTVICDFLAQANALTHLDLSSTECVVEQIFGALIRGCCQNLAFLNLSGNQFTSRKSKDTNLPAAYKKFFSSTAALYKINMSDCRLPADAARAMFLGLIENNVVKEVSVDISKNELKASGLRAITGPLSQISNLICLDISDNGFETDLIALCESLCKNKAIKKLYLGQNCNKGRNLNNIMEALIKLISVENSPIEFLSLADSRLKQSVSLLFDSLGTNESLTELDISGNMMGDEGARVLAKALQINAKLRKIHWDRNNVTQNGLRDIALALENNLTLQSMPIPITDVTLCLKPATEKALKQIEKCLSRNHSPSQAVTEQAYRLHQGLMMSSTQQQMVDKLIVHLQDTARLLRNSSDELVKTGLRDARRCINDADKLKQLFLKFHMSTGYKSLQERISSLSADIFNSAQKQMEENVQNILDCAESNCPFVTGREGVKESLKIACEGKANISKAFIDTVILQQLAPVIFNEVSEKNLNLSTLVSDAMMDKVIEQLESQQKKLDVLVKEYQNSQQEKPAENEENGDNISEVAQKAKNRLSAAINRRSMRVSDDEGDVFAASHPRRRPTISRKKRTSVADDEVEGGREEAKKKEVPVVISGKDLNVPLATGKELVHHTKNRARPARGRRPPTRPSAQQSAAIGPEVKADTFDVGIDDFFTKQPIRPKSAVITSNSPREHAIPKSATISQRPHHGSKKKNDKEDEEENHKEPQEKKKHGLLGSLGLFKKKGEKDKKSPTVPRKDSKNKDHRKSIEDLVDGGRSEDANRDRKSSPLTPKPAEDLAPKPAPEKPSKPHPEKPPKQETPPVNEKEKEVKKEPKRPPRPAAQTSAATKEKTEVAEPKEKEEVKEEEKEKEKEKEEEKEKDKEENEKESKNEAQKEQETEQEEKTEDNRSSQQVNEETETAKPQAKAPPKFGVGLAMGPMGGDLLAEMKKRQEKNNSGKKSPEPKPRARVATNPEVQRPVVPIRPSSMKRSMKAKSASDLVAAVEPEPKPIPAARAKSREIIHGEPSNEENKPKEVPKKTETKDGSEPVKPVPPKPVPKEKPSVAARPTIPKRPPSITKNRPGSQNSAKEKRKSLEAKEPSAEKEKKETTQSHPAEDKKGDEQPGVNEPSEKSGKETPSEKRPAKEISGENPPGKEISGGNPPSIEISGEKPEEKDEVSKKDIPIDAAKEPEDEKPAEKKEEKTEVNENKEQEKNLEEKEQLQKQPEEEQSKPETNESSDKNKDDNDNETEIPDKPETSAETSASEVASASEEVTTDDGNNDDVIKSVVDVETLTEAIQSSKDTSL